MICEIPWSRYVSSIVNHLFQITHKPWMLLVGQNKTNGAKTIVLKPSKPITSIVLREDVDLDKIWCTQNAD